MPEAMPSRAQLEQELQQARAAVIHAEDTDDFVTAVVERAHCDSVLDIIHAHAPDVDI
jgi:hypothetical protein